MKTIITSQRNGAVHNLRVLLGLFHCFPFFRTGRTDFFYWEFHFQSKLSSHISQFLHNMQGTGGFFFSRKLFHIQNYWSGWPILTFGKYNRLSSNTFPPDYTTIHIKDTIEIKPIKSLKWLKVILFISDREKKSWWRLKDIHHVRSNPLTPRCWLGIPTTGLQEMPGTQLGSVQ